MSKEEFVAKVKDALALYYGADADVTVQDMLKNNGVKHTGVSIRFADGGQIAPVVYIDEFYARLEDGEMDFDECIEKITDIANYHKVPEDLIGIEKKLMSWEYCKDKVYPVLISTERNKENLERWISTEFLDLSVIYIIRLDGNENGEFASVKITYEMMNVFGVTIDEIHEIALENMKTDDYKLQDMREIIAGMIGDDEFDSLDLMPGPKMAVISCKTKMYGAAGVLDKTFMESITTGNAQYYLIPSSVHEWIMLPDDGETDPESLRAMIREVNETQVKPQEVLSDHAYLYRDGELLCA